MFHTHGNSYTHTGVFHAHGNSYTYTDVFFAHGNSYAYADVFSLIGHGNRGVDLRAAALEFSVAWTLWQLCLPVPEENGMVVRRCYRA